MRDFIRMRFKGMLFPLYVKVHTNHVNFYMSALRSEEKDVMVVKFVTGRFPYKNELSLFSVEGIAKDIYGSSVVTIRTASDMLESLHLVEMDEDSDEIQWSRRYYSEKFGFSYSDDTLNPMEELKSLMGE